MSATIHGNFHISNPALNLSLAELAQMPGWKTWSLENLHKLAAQDNTLPTFTSKKGELKVRTDDIKNGPNYFQLTALTAIAKGGKPASPPHKRSNFRTYEEMAAKRGDDLNVLISEVRANELTCVCPVRGQGIDATRFHAWIVNVQNQQRLRTLSADAHARKQFDESKAVAKSKTVNQQLREANIAANRAWRERTGQPEQE